MPASTFHPALLKLLARHGFREVKYENQDGLTCLSRQIQVGQMPYLRSLWENGTQFKSTDFATLELTPDFGLNLVINKDYVLESNRQMISPRGIDSHSASLVNQCGVPRQAFVTALYQAKADIEAAKQGVAAEAIENPLQAAMQVAARFAQANLPVLALYLVNWRNGEPQTNECSLAFRTLANTYREAGLPHHLDHAQRIIESMSLRQAAGLPLQD